MAPEMMDKFSRLLDEIGMDQPLWKELSSFDEAHTFCEKLGLPGAPRMTSSRKRRPSRASIRWSSHRGREGGRDGRGREERKVVMYFISDHVENAGVHSGDTTLIHPPQDLNRKQSAASRTPRSRLRDAQNVTRVFDIQFIAKNNDIKVIGCHLRAGYPHVPLPPDYVGVEVPQFSFSQFSGVDPVLGVHGEVTSTGEVACFGMDKYEVYDEKLEFLHSVQRLGAADFFTEHNVPCKVLPGNLGEDSEQKSEYSPKQHLADHLIDMYINLPSKAATAARTRHMAVARLQDAPRGLSGGLQHVTRDATPSQAHQHSELRARRHYVERKIRHRHEGGGFVTALVFPVGLQTRITDQMSLDKVASNIAGLAYCSYAMSMTASSVNVIALDDGLEAGVKVLFMPFARQPLLMRGPPRSLSNLDAINVFSFGRVPHKLATLPLLFGAVAAGRLTLDDVRKRLHNNPLRIFALLDQGHAKVENIFGRKYSS
ncbi:glutathione synthetase ATP-binding domain-like protein [Lentinus tigrinus ALCF2SS1-6]|uniref:Glutathione synthetase ATP-binding domain-like protein n=1 Tax=Lentinus tigrinus ALCF2SS1-6 TaxID=1328759 RepID=A0A5C2RPE3_9APHY|nr:glutathione synthetase ATP-binding domain-like protein [Lentinus tigrinus ALCF2SS1-6]